MSTTDHYADALRAIGTLKALAELNALMIGGQISIEDAKIRAEEIKRDSLALRDRVRREYDSAGGRAPQE